MMKRIVSLLLSILILGALVGCGPQSSPVSDSSTGNQSAVSDSASVDSSDSADTPEKRSAQEILEASEHLVGLCDQGNSRIIVSDLAVEDWENDNAVVWEYKDDSCRSVAGIKLRWSEVFQELVVAYCWHGGAAIVSYEDKKELYSTNLTGVNPHSVEILPDGHLIVASSTDNDVRLYDAEDQKNGKGRHCQKIDFPNAHGVLWDPEYEVVWLWGTDQLSAYSVVEKDGKPWLAPMGGMTYKAPKSGAHDLCPVYGNKDQMFITCGNGIMIFDKSTEEFSFAYPGGSVGRKHSYAPGTGNFEQDGVFFFTSIKDDTMVLNDWCTNIVFVYVPNADGVGKLLRRKAPNDAYYKVRTWSPDYQ